MAVFVYKALNAAGRTEKGMIEADSSRHARQVLKGKNLLPVEVNLRATATLKRATRKKWRLRSLFQRRMRPAELALITRQLATLVQAAMPLEECLKAVAEQCEKTHLKSLLLAVRSRVQEGYTLADSLGEQHHAFDHLFCSMIAAGEKSGHLDLILNRLADYTEQLQHMKNKLLQAMLYPLILTLVACAVITILLASVVPKVMVQFVHLGQQLPLSTQWLMAISDAVQNYGIFFVLALIVLPVGFQRLLLHPDLRIGWDRFILQIPIIGRVARGLNTARFARTLSILSSSSVSLIESLQIAAGVTSNRYFEQQILSATERVREGNTLRAALTELHLFPSMMLYMIASGERSGELENMLMQAANNQDREFDALVNLSLGIFEPVLIVAMAGIVLFIVLSILQPMLQLNNMVGM